MKFYWVLILLAVASCNTSDNFPEFETMDTDFSKGRLNHKQIITIHDLEKFHGHLCDGLVTSLCEGYAFVVLMFFTGFAVWANT